MDIFFYWLNVSWSEFQGFVYITTYFLFPIIMNNATYIVPSALIAGFLGRNRKIGLGWSLFFCLFLSPIVGLIIVLFSPKKDKDFINMD